MCDITALFDYFKKSKLISIGYSSRTESIKDELLSQLPIIRVDKPMGLDFTLKPYIRDSKIDQILDDKDEIRFILIESVLLDNRVDLKHIFERIRSELIDSNYKLILTNHLNRDVTDTANAPYSYSTITTLIHFDFFFVLSPNREELKVIKNRHGSKDEIISLEGLSDIKYEF